MRVAEGSSTIDAVFSAVSVSSAKQAVQGILSEAGITIGGGRPWDIRVHDDRFYRRVLAEGSLGLGESYMEEWWECERLDEFIERLVRLFGDREPWTARTVLATLWAKIWNLQSRWGSQRVAREHYDLGNDLYMTFLDPYNQYTCGYFQGTDDLNEAQEKKLDLQCRKLRLTKDDRVLDIGCGWGGFAKFAAERYGCSVTGITISKEQKKYAEQFCRGLPVEIRLCDYRDLTGTFDKVLICGMIEHVGYKNYRTIMEVVRRCLVGRGLFLLHTIGANLSSTISDLWIAKYIFPNSMLPSMRQITEAVEGLFVVEDWHNFGAYYEKTLLSWYRNFLTNWTRLRDRYSQRFYRMFTYYLLSSAGAFRARRMQLWQVVFSKGGVPGGYVSVR